MRNSASPNLGQSIALAVVLALTSVLVITLMSIASNRF